MKLTTHCPLCAKALVLLSEHSSGETTKWKNYKCGHTFIQEFATRRSVELTSVNGSFTARPYQAEGVDFIVNGAEGNEQGYNCIIGDQMRLGKTPQSLLALKTALREWREANPEAERPSGFALIIVKAANLYQWVREYKTWSDLSIYGIFVIQGSKAWIPPGFTTYIVSMDTFSKPAVVKQLTDMNFKLVIADEAHSFKNTSSKRSSALVDFLHKVSEREVTYEVNFSCINCSHTWTESVTKRLVLNEGHREEFISKSTYCPECNTYNRVSGHKETVNREKSTGLILLTGTAIKNRANEYFVPLNLLAPDKFPSEDRFKRDWLTRDPDGQYRRLDPRKIDAFKRLTAPYILRREKEDVYTDLPPLNRMFTVVEMEDAHLREAYNKVLDKIEAKISMTGSLKFFDSIGELQMLRQICGMSKVNWAANYIEASFLDSDNVKFAVGIHHHSVRDTLAYKLAHLGTMKLSGEDSPQRKDQIMNSFRNAPERVLIINMLAGGVGMDFSYVPNALILERQWSAADEEQFEFRFFNPDKEFLKNHGLENKITNIEYIVAKGTVDEWFFDLVESKRRIFGETISTQWSIDQDNGSFKELMERTLANRL